MAQPTFATRAETLFVRDPGWVGVSDTGMMIANLPNGLVAVRNSTDPEGPALLFTPDEIKAFIPMVKEGLFDVFLE